MKRHGLDLLPDQRNGTCGSPIGRIKYTDCVHQTVPKNSYQEIALDDVPILFYEFTMQEFLFSDYRSDLLAMKNRLTIVPSRVFA